jgi:GH24 family phage-related lysozyme (muramidase)
MNEPKVYHGSLAVKMAAEYWDFPLNQIGRLCSDLIKEEGFVPELYTDTKDVQTFGVGQTAEWLDKDFFREVYPMFLKEAESYSARFYSLPYDTRFALLSAVYRGDLKRTHKTAALIRNNEWEAAAEEYLNHNDYRRSKMLNAQGIEHGVAARMERNAEGFRMADSHQQ